ncbi:hypothetical protein HDU96_009152 [Phlyctochytrium bullatum]|nr:hypothetical protein HDU96_009152 [Phlyctochytrium bullatum]
MNWLLQFLWAACLLSLVVARPSPNPAIDPNSEQGKRIIEAAQKAGDNFVFRALNKKNAESLGKGEGLKPNAAMGTGTVTPLKHVADYEPNTEYSSTTTDVMTALKYADPSRGVVLIDKAKVGADKIIDFNNKATREAHFGVDKGFTKDPTAAGNDHVAMYPYDVGKKYAGDQAKLDEANLDQNRVARGHANSQRDSEILIHGDVAQDACTVVIRRRDGSRLMRRQLSCPFPKKKAKSAKDAKTAKEAKKAKDAKGMSKEKSPKSKDRSLKKGLSKKNKDGKMSKGKLSIGKGRNKDAKKGKGGKGLLGKGLSPKKKAKKTKAVIGKGRDGKKKASKSAGKKTDKKTGRGKVTPKGKTKGVKPKGAKPTGKTPKGTGKLGKGAPSRGKSGKATPKSAKKASVKKPAKKAVKKASVKKPAKKAVKKASVKKPAKKAVKKAAKKPSMARGGPKPVKKAAAPKPAPKGRGKGRK